MSALALALLLAQPSPPDLAVFQRNDKALEGRSVEAAASRSVDQNLEILVRVVHTAARRGQNVNAALTPYDEAAKQDGELEETAFTSCLGRAVRQGDRWVVAVTYGAVSRLAAFDPRGRRLSVPSALRRLAPHALSAEPVADGLIVLAPWRHDLGFRTSTRVFALRRTTAGYVPGDDRSFAYTLDWGGVEVRGSRMAAKSLDAPKNFAFTAPVLALRRESMFRAANGRLRPTETILRDEELRAVDAWISEARQAPRPTAVQRRFRTGWNASRVLEHHAVKSDGSKATASLETQGTWWFELAKQGGRWTVTRVRPPASKVNP